MREAGWLFPRLLGVAVGALQAQLAGMHVAMAGLASGFQGCKCRVEIVPLEHGPILRADVLRHVALGAFELRVLAFEFPSRLGVVEFLSGNRPTHQPVVESIVFRVAARAIITTRIRLDLRRVVTVLLS